MQMRCKSHQAGLRPGAGRLFPDTPLPRGLPAPADLQRVPGSAPPCPAAGHPGKLRGGHDPGKGLGTPSRPGRPSPCTPLYPQTPPQCKWCTNCPEGACIGSGGSCTSENDCRINQREIFAAANCSEVSCEASDCPKCTASGKCMWTRQFKRTGTGPGGTAGLGVGGGAAGLRLRVQWGEDQEG